MSISPSTYSSKKCIQHLFEAQVLRTPEAIALEDDYSFLSYGELNRRANQLARYLHRFGAGPDVRVGICVERSPEMLIGLLAILKAGSAYVPIDPAYPKSRIEMMLQDAGLAMVVTQERLTATLSGYGTRLIEIDRQWDEAERESDLDPEAKASGENLAYTIYTSGSTGKPKGVEIRQAGLVNYISYAANELEINEADRFLQFASLSFDTAAEEIFVALTSGARLILRNDAMLSSASNFLESCAQRKVSVLDLPTAYWHEMVEEIAAKNLKLPSDLRLVCIGGEAALKERLEAWDKCVGTTVRLVNTYGPTETTIVALMHGFQWDAEREEKEVAIGRAVANAQAHIILEGIMEPAPVGVAGELYIGGEGLARGYLNRPDLTAERFVPNPFSYQIGERLYRTGDEARQRSDGRIGYLGRVDSQVKIRGYRIELGEIEAALREHPEVREAVVVLREEQAGKKQLVAYVARGKNGSKTGGLRKHLKERLPVYMIPSAIVELESLPKTPGMKVDRHALPAPSKARPDLDEDYVAPRGKIEETVAMILADVLGIDQVGIKDSFLELGGDSLRAIQVLSRIRECFELDLPLSSLFGAHTVENLASAIDDGKRRGRGLTLPPIKSASRDGYLPLSFPQEAVWFLTQLSGGTAAYNTQLVIRFIGQLDVPALEKSLDEIVRRHEIFRTTFDEVEGLPVQIVHPSCKVKLPVMNLEELPERERQERAESIIAEECSHIFDTSQLLLIRWTLVRLSEQEHLLVQVEHHFVHDGWSLSVILRELWTIYEAYSNRKASPLPELPIQFGDFTVWQRELMQGQLLEDRLGYWEKKLADIPPLLELPTDRSRPTMQSYRGAVHAVELDVPFSRRLIEFSERHGVSLFMTMLAAFKALLYHYTGREDMVVGTSVANRNLREIEYLIGMIVNTLVLRTDMSGDPAFRQLLDRVRDVMLEAYEHQDLPFEKLVERLHPQRVKNHNPLYQVMFNFHDSQIPDLDIPGLYGRLEYRGNRSAKFDLDVLVIPRFAQSTGRTTEAGQDVLYMEWEYNTDLFDAATIEQMARHYRASLEALIDNPDQRLSELSLLGQSELQQILREWNDTVAAYPQDQCVHHLFAAQTQRTPDAVAVEHEGSLLTYGELNRRANQLAHYLRRLGVGPEVRVGICMERSIEIIVGLLGIVKAGGAYVPIDPAYPKQRVRLIVEDAELAIVVTRAGSRGLLAGLGGKMVDIDGDWSQIALECGQNPEVELDGENLVYTIYTSGSTGRPKGVGIRHRGLINYISHAVKELEMSEQDKFLQFASLSFDTAAEEIFVTLTSGARLILRNDTMLNSVKKFLESCEEWGVSVLDPPTAYWHEMVAEMVASKLTMPKSARMIYVGGERVVEQRVNEWREIAPEVKLYNGYGPTEATIVALTDELSGTSRDVAIGRAVGNTSAYILDKRMEPVPVGVAGELYIGGEGLARAYLTRADLTSERFVPDPWSRQAGARLYRTGDMARHKRDGRVEYLGRVDSQVKIRGYRVELGEIEAVLREHPAIKEAVVVMREERGEKHLVGYVVAREGGPKKEEMRRYLKERLPVYMIPSTFVSLLSLPLSPNGKVDHKALLLLDNPQPVSESVYVAPRTKLEQVITNIWCTVLKIEKLGMNDNFFDLGGTSLTLMQVRSNLRDALNKDIPLIDLFEYSTVSELACHLSQKDGRPQVLQQIQDRVSRQKEALRRRRPFAQA